MNINDILEVVMTFINENTNILIGICIFLIFVLVGYLIDNSVKSKRVRKDIKNADQVPENIKEEIIKEEKEKEEKTIQDKIEEPKEEIKLDEEPKIDENTPAPTDNVFESAVEIPAGNVTDELNNNVPLSNDILDAGIVNDIDEVVNTIDNSPMNISLENNNSIYKNNKGLSEILFENTNTLDTPSIDTNDIFNVDNKIEIKSEDSELDDIMNKLNNMQTNEEEDNYTNIF